MESRGSQAIPTALRDGTQGIRTNDAQAPDYFKF